MNRIFNKSDRYSHISVFFLCLLLFSVSLSGCTMKKAVNDKESVSRTGFFLNTIVKITLYDDSSPDLIDDCFSICRQYEQEFSRTDPKSTLYQLNHEIGEVRSLTPALKDVIQIGLDYYQLSDGIFDITIAPLSDLWAFTSENPAVPSIDQIKKTKEQVNASLVHLYENTLVYESVDIMLDFGGIAKGYIADRIKEYLIAQGVSSAVIDLGGNVLCIGSKPDGSNFRIGIRKPFALQGESALILSVNDLSVVTSGVYERCFYENDILYHHLLDPSTGYPMKSGLNSVTIISKSSVDGDALSTFVFALGAEKGINYINSLSDTYAIFITDENDILYSKGTENFLP